MGVPQRLSNPADAYPSVLDSVLALAQRRGWAVFPCWNDKSPRTRHGHNDATTDAEQIAEWWTRWPDAYMGIPGRINRLVFADFDPHRGGNPDPSWPDTLTVKTPRGWHHYYTGTAPIGVD